MKSSDITVIPPGGGALAKPKAKPATAGLALINHTLDADFVQAMVDADEIRLMMQQQDIYLGEGEIRAEFLDSAKPLHRRWLPKVVRAVKPNRVLMGIVWSFSDQLTQADASVMLHYLFDAMGKRRGDEGAAKLLACNDIFSPTSNALGNALGLWKSVSRHPAILALAIKHLMAAKIYEPAELELREALDKVRQRVGVQGEYVSQWLEKLERADEIVFTFDRPAWDAAYADVPSAVALAMRDRLVGEGPELDDDDNPVPSSPRWQALNELWELKLAAEKAKELEPMREAACKAPVAKKTRRSKKTRRKPAAKPKA